MAVYYPTNVTCPCGHTFSENLARSVNAGRTPEIRAKILSGEFHQVRCPQCGRKMAVEKPFFYTDLSRHAIYYVQPRSARYRYRAHSAKLTEAANAVPAELASSDPRQLRVIYGLDELREKIAIQDAGFDDRTVELLKIFMLHEHPFLLKKPRLLVHLTGADGSSVDLVAYYHHENDLFKVSLTRAVVEDVLGREKELRAWMRKAIPGEDLFDLKDHWVSFRRWSSRYDALDALRTLSKEIGLGLKPPLRTPEREKLVRSLPRGSELPPWAKRDLNVVFDYAKKISDQEAEDKLFEVRFGIELENEWSHNKNTQDIGIMWALLKDLPPSNVDGNTKIAKLLLDKGEGGGTYGSNTIDIGEEELDDRERFEDVLRHEVGHAVHEQRDELVTPWLQKNFGWQLLPSTKAGIDQWVELMGGWGPMSPNERTEAEHLLRQAVGPGGTWKAGKKPCPPRTHPWWGKTFGPRLATEKSGKEDWFTQYKHWYRARDKAFALNYWYGQFIVVDVKTLDFIAKMPDNYAAMSQYEFFAELYALFYDVDDKKRDVIPPSIGKWLEENIGKRDPANPRRPMARRRPAGAGR